MENQKRNTFEDLFWTRCCGHVWRGMPSALSRCGDSLSLSSPVLGGSSLPSAPGQDWWLWKSYLRQRSKSDRIHTPQCLTLSSPAFSTWVMTLHLSICLTSGWWMVRTLRGAAIFLYWAKKQTGNVKFVKNSKIPVWCGRRMGNSVQNFMWSFLNSSPG